MRLRTSITVSNPHHHQHGLFLIILFVFLSCGHPGIYLPTVDAQSCQVWWGYPTSCQNYLAPNTTVYVAPESGSLANGEQLLDYTINTLFAFQPPVPQDCLSAYIAILCSSWLRPCAVIDNATQPVPINTCRSICYNYLDKCSDFAKSIGVPIGAGFYLPKGSSVNENFCIVNDTSLDNPPFFPNVSTQVTLDNRTTELPCNPLANRTITVASCNDPLKRINGRCSFVCPMPAFTDEQYDSAELMQNIVGWFSWAGTAALITSLLAYPPARRFPKVLVLMIAISANIAAGAMILPTFAGYEEVWCGGSDVPIIPTFKPVVTSSGTSVAVAENIGDLITKSSLCTFQGAMLHFGVLSSTFWWAIIAFNMSTELLFGQFFEKKEQMWKWIRLGTYITIAWGVSFVFMVIVASADRMGFTPGDTYCFVTDEDDSAWQLVFFFIPVGLCLLVGLTFFLVAIVKVIITAIRLRKPLIIQYFRLLIFIFIFLFLYTFIFSYEIKTSADSSEISQGYGDYFLCLVSRLSSDCHLSDSVSNYNLSMLKAFAISSLGILLFINFMSWEILKQWYLIGKYSGRIAYFRNMLELRRLGTLLATYSTVRRSTGSSLTVSTLAGKLDSFELQEEEEGYDDDDEDNDDDKGVREEEEEEEEEEAGRTETKETDDGSSSASEDGESEGEL